MRKANKSAVEKRAARRFGEFAHSVRRNLRQADRIRERAEQATRLCYAKAGVAMLDAKASSGMTEEGFAAWLAPFNLNHDRLLQCLELGQAVLHRRKAEATQREEFFGMSVTGTMDEVSSHVRLDLPTVRSPLRLFRLVFGSHDGTAYEPIP